MADYAMLLCLLFGVAFFYSAVGHGGASGYLVVLSILGFGIALIKPGALLLNIFVSGIAFYQYYRGGHFRWKLFYPFAILSIPMAFAGSYIKLNPHLYKQILGCCLILAVLRILGIFNRKQGGELKEVPLFAGILIGAALGFLSGMIGIGGGILLSPVILLCRWGRMKDTAAASALFILVNSIAGMIGFIRQGTAWSPVYISWLAVAIAGGLLGSYWGSCKAEQTSLKYVLASVLLFAAVKLVLV
ncbi:MAG TPA: sulfite exporter TauE/SafE family protein [Bacteroidia bacterium]|nr:sulfite exporter TauE/SafE family protein [Bacteroidia bacterium]